MPTFKIDYVKVIRTKRGQKEYLYFDTGQKGFDGKPLLKPLPARDDPKFWDTYNSLKAGRTRRQNVANALTIGKLFDMWQKSPEVARLADSTRSLYLRYGAEVVDLLMPMSAAAVEGADIQLIKDSNGHRIGAANMMISATSSMYQWAMSEGRKYVAANPCALIKLYDTGEHDPWPEYVLEAALEADDEDVRLGVALLYYTGQRLGDAVRLTLPAPGVTEWQVRQQKTDWDGIMPIHRELKPLIEWRRAQKRPTLTVLTSADGQTATTAGAMRPRLQAWVKERFGLHVVPHGLRKNAVNTMLELGFSTAQVSSITGQTLQTVEHYAKKRDQAHLARSTIHLWGEHTKKRKTSGKHRRKA